MIYWRRGLVLCVLAASSASWAQSDIGQHIIELQQDETWGSPAHKWINALPPKRTPELIPFIPKIERWHAMSIVAAKLAEDNVEAAIPDLIKILGKRFPEVRSDSPVFEPLKKFSWKAIGPLIRALDSPEPSLQYQAAQLLAERCRFGPQDARLRPVMRRLSRSSSPSLSIVGVQGLHDLAFRISGGWMGETPIVYEMTNREALGDLIDAFLAGPHESQESARTKLERFMEWVPVEGDPVKGNLSDPNVTRRFTVDDRYLGHRMPEVRMVALAALARAEMIGMPHIAALGDAEEGVRQTAVRALMLKFDPAWAPEVAKHLKAANPGIRAAAAKALGFSYQPSAATLLQEHLKDSSPGVRAAVKTAIDRIEGRGLARAELSF